CKPPRGRGGLPPTHLPPLLSPPAAREIRRHPLCRALRRPRVLKRTDPWPQAPAIRIGDENCRSWVQTTVPEDQRAKMFGRDPTQTILSCPSPSGSTVPSRRRLQCFEAQEQPAVPQMPPPLRALAHVLWPVPVRPMALRLTLPHIRRIHPENLPNMPIRVLEAAAEHETVVLRLTGLFAAGLDRLVHQFVNPRLAL